MEDRNERSSEKYSGEILNESGESAPLDGELRPAFRKLQKAFIYTKEEIKPTIGEVEAKPTMGKSEEDGDEQNFGGARAFSYSTGRPVEGEILPKVQIGQEKEMEEVVIEEQAERNKVHTEKMVENLTGVVKEVESQELFAKGLNFSLRLVGIKEIIREESEGEYRRVVYKFKILIGLEEYSQEVDATDLENFYWVRRATAGRAYIEGGQNGNAFKRFIHEALEDGLQKVETEIYYLQNGWKRLDDGRLAYVCNHGIVGSPNGWIHGCDELKFQSDVSITAAQSFQAFLGMERITCRPEFARCLMTFVSLSVMASLFEKAGFPVKFILGILGTTNTMKTSTALVFTRIFNALEPQKPEVTFSSTKSGIETMVSRYSDGVLLVDDFMPADSRKKQAELNGKLELLCRLYGDRTAKKRMLDFCEKKVEYPVKGCCVFTGEHLTGVESSRTRILVLKLEKGEVQKDVLSFYQENPLILPTYLYRFIAWLQEHVEQILKFIAQSVQAYRKTADYKVARLNETQAILFTAIDIMETCWKNEGFVASDSFIGDEWKSSIAEVVAKNERQLAEGSVSEVIVKAFLEKIFQAPQECKPLEEIRKSERAKIYFDEEHFYIRAGDLYIVVKEYCHKFDYEFYLQKSMVIDKLKEMDMLETLIDEKGYERAARKLMQGRGIDERYLYLKRKKIEKYEI